MSNPPDPEKPSHHAIRAALPDAERERREAFQDSAQTWSARALREIAAKNWGLTVRCRWCERSTRLPDFRLLELADQLGERHLRPALRCEGCGAQDALISTYQAGGSHSGMNRGG